MDELAYNMYKSDQIGDKTTFASCRESVELVSSSFLEKLIQESIGDLLQRFIAVSIILI